MKSIGKLFLLLGLLYGVSTFAQNKSRYKTGKLGGATFFLEKGKNQLESNPEKAVFYLQKALESSIPNKNYKVEGEAFFLLGIINRNKQQFDIAIDYYLKAQTAYKKGKQQEEVTMVTRELADSYFLNKNYKEAERYFNLYLKSANDNGDLQAKIYSHYSLASVYKELGDLPKALELLKLADSLNINNDKIEENKAIINFKRGEVLEAQSQDDLALEAYELSESISRSSNSNSIAVKSNKRQGKLLEKKGKKNEAVEKKKEGLMFLEEIISEDAEMSKEPEFDVEKEISRVNVDIANSYLGQDSSEQAIPYLKKAIQSSSKANALIERKDAYGLLSEAYRRTNKEDSALISYQNYIGLIDSIYLRKEEEIRAALELNKQLSQQLQRISSLETDRELQEKTIELLEIQRKAEEQNNKQLKLLVYGLIGGLLLLLVLVYFMNKSAKQKKLTNQLLALKNLRTQMNPHFIFNALNSVNNFISQNDERSANRYLSDFSSLMRLVLENSEFDFIPLAKELEILRLYISLEHDRFREKFDYTFTVDENLNVENYEIPPMLVQPYIENAVWHGLRYLEEKGNLSISFVEKKDFLEISVIDDGIGRKQSGKLKTKNQKTGRSTAMKNIEQRLRIINELYNSSVQVLIEDLNADGSGTQVRIIVPDKKA